MNCFGRGFDFLDSSRCSVHNLHLIRSIERDHRGSSLSALLVRHYGVVGISAMVGGWSKLQHAMARMFGPLPCRDLVLGVRRSTLFE